MCIIWPGASRAFQSSRKSEFYIENWWWVASARLKADVFCCQKRIKVVFYCKFIFHHCIKKNKKESTVLRTSSYHSRAYFYSLELKAKSDLKRFAITPIQLHTWKCLHCVLCGRIVLNPENAEGLVSVRMSVWMHVMMLIMQIQPYEMKNSFKLDFWFCRNWNFAAIEGKSD